MADRRQRTVWEAEGKEQRKQRVSDGEIGCIEGRKAVMSRSAVAQKCALRLQGHGSPIRSRQHELLSTGEEREPDRQISPAGRSGGAEVPAGRLPVHANAVRSPGASPSVPPARSRLHQKEKKQHASHTIRINAFSMPTSSEIR